MCGSMSLMTVMSVVSFSEGLDHFDVFGYRAGPDALDVLGVHDGLYS